MLNHKVTLRARSATFGLGEFQGTANLTQNVLSYASDKWFFEKSEVALKLDHVDVEKAL